MTDRKKPEVIDDGDLIETRGGMQSLSNVLNAVSTSESLGGDETQTSLDTDGTGGVRDGNDRFLRKRPGR